jgi:hypothetical protein
MHRFGLVVFFLLVLSEAASATDECLTVEIVGKDYPAAREILIANGWKPFNFTPPFEGAPFADWVKIRNYTEVEACAGTGLAPCKFVFVSGKDADSRLNVFTQGEKVGSITGYECMRAAG